MSAFGAPGAALGRGTAVGRGLPGRRLERRGHRARGGGGGLGPWRLTWRETAGAVQEGAVPRREPRVGRPSSSLVLPPPNPRTGGRGRGSLPFWAARILDPLSLASNLMRQLEAAACASGRDPVGHVWRPLLTRAAAADT